MKDFFKKETPVLIILFIPFIFMTMYWSQLPEQLPVHFNFRGEPDGYGPKYLLPLMNIFLYLLLLILPKIDSTNESFKLFAGTYYKIRVFLTLFFSTFLTLVATKAIWVDIAFTKYFFITLLLFFMILGNYMTNLKPNWFIGIRTPWTMSNETVWRKTHFLAGRLWFFGGLAGVISSLLVNDNYLPYITFGLIILLALMPVIYSVIIYKKLETKLK